MLVVVVGFLALTSPTDDRRETVGAIGAIDAWVAKVVSGPAGAVVDVELEQARAELEAAGLWPNPGARLERQSGPWSDQTRGSQDFLIAEVPLVLSGRTGVEQEAARARIDAATHERSARRLALARAARVLWVDVVVAARRHRALVDERAALAAVVEAARARVVAGVAAEATALRLEVELARVEEEVAAAAIAATLHRSRAAAVIGEEDVDFADVLPGADAVVGASAAEAPHALALREAGRAASLDEEAAARRAIPDVTVSGGPALLSSGSADFDVGYLVAVDVPLPLFDRARGERARARAVRSAFDAERKVVTLTWQAEHRAALARADDVHRRRQAHDQTIARVQQLAHSAARDLVVGSGDVVGVVDAVRLRRELALVTVDLDEALARAAIDLTYFAGTDVPAQEQP